MIQTVLSLRKSFTDTNSMYYVPERVLMSQNEFADSFDTNIHKSPIELSDLAQTKVSVHKCHVIQFVLNLIIQ